MAISDSIGLLFKIQADASQAKSEVDQFRSNFANAVKESEKDAGGFYNVLTQIRIGLTQLGRGDIGGVPNLIKAFALAQGEGAKFQSTLKILDAGLLSVGETSTKAKTLFETFATSIKKAVTGTDAEAKFLRLSFDTLGVDLNKALLAPEQAFSKLLKNFANAKAGSLEANAAMDVLNVGAGKAAEGILQAGNALNHLGISISGTTILFTSLTAVVAIAGLAFVKMGRDAAELQAGLEKLHDETGLTAERIAYLQVAAKATGTELSSYTNALKSLKEAAAAANNNDEEMIKLFQLLGVTTKNISEKELEQVVKKLDQVTDESIRTQIAQKLLGGEARDLSRYFAQLNEKGGELKTRIQSVASVTDGEARDAAKRYREETALLGAEWNQFYYTIANRVLPILGDLVKALNSANGKTALLVGGVGAFGVVAAIEDNQKNAIAGTPGGPEGPFVPEGFSPNAKLTKNLGDFLKRDSGSSSGGRSGPKDLTDAQLAVKLLKAQQDEAQRAYNGTREAAQRLLEVTMRLIEAETREANERLPNKAAARMAEVRQQQLKALEKYAEQLQSVSDAELKHLEDLGNTINKQNEETRRANEEADQFVKDQYEAESDAYYRRAILQQEFHRTFHATRVKAIRDIAALEIDAEERKFERLKQEAEKELEFLSENDDRRKAIKDRLDAEEAEKDARQALIRRQAVLDEQRAQPNSNLNLLGSGINDALNGLYAINAALGQQTGFWEQIGVAMRAYVVDLQETLPNAMQLAVISLQAVGDAVANSISAFITGKQTLRQAIGGLVAAMLEPYKQFALTKAKIHFAAAIGDFAFGNYAGAAKHLLAGAAWVGVAGLIGAAGSLIAGSGASPAAATPAGASAASAQSQTRIIEQGDRQRAPAPQVIIIRAEHEPGVIVRRVMEDYSNNGSTRQVLRRDLLGDTAG